MKQAQTFKLKAPGRWVRIPATLAAGALAGLLVFLVLSCWPPAIGALVAATRARGSTPQILATTDSVLEEMSQITGLPIRAPLKKQVVGRPEVEKYLAENLHAEYTPEELHAQQAALRAFGLVTPEFDLEKFLIGFYTEQAAGFYDPRRETMFLAEWLDEDMQKVAIAHELVHALQDQSFDLEKFLRASRPDDDATNARQAVVEGYATAAMMQHLIRPMELTRLPSLSGLINEVIRQKMEEFPIFSAAPYFLRVMALFPYTEGMMFVQNALSRGGWPRVNAVFADPPGSTQAIFQPEVYFERRSLRRVSLPRPGPLSEAKGLQLVAENVMGELGYYALLGQFVSEDEAKSVASRWVADRYIVYETAVGGRYTLVARARWSSAEASAAFFRNYQAILQRKYPGLLWDRRSGGTLLVGSTDGGTVILRQRDDECVWVEGVPKEQAEAMLHWLASLN